MMKQEITGTEEVMELLERVSDPEIPVLSVVDLGVINEVRKTDDLFEILITPTYTGCPAMNMIEQEIIALMEKEGIPARVTLVLSPAWSTDRMSEKGKKKLKEYGIAPPEEEDISLNTLFGKAHAVTCPRCGSRHTEMISQFGSTACKALYKCLDCLEPFDYFKCHR